ncbi:phage tail tape measure protein [Alkalihalobacillus sp. LMS6]|nr:phage tail tape measure protein [Alkalihalobacillus sp. LMS6]UTR08535.1 phage tail tape measure protein [Alkalihalobacillus sp. LMS6]
MQGGRAGTALRAALLSLANPTGQTTKAMEDLGIEVTTADGAMKPLPELIGHINEKLDGMTEAQKTQTVAQLVGREAASGFIALLEQGEDSLAEYADGLRNAEGAAQQMADTQNDTVLGAFDALKSALSDVGISIGQEYLPAVREVIDGATDMVRNFGELDPQLVSMALNFAAVSSGIALATTTIIKLGGAVRGLFAAMGPGGWLIIGLSLLGGAIAAYVMEADKMTEVSLENANAMIESEASLRGQLDRYDELAQKTRLSNDELGLFMDYNTRIANEIDPSRIEALRNEQDQLAEKSGLSNAELNEMVGLNNELIGVLPDASASVTEHGNAILGGTDHLREYNEQQREAIRLELENQRIIAEANYAENLETRKTLTEEIAGHQEKVVETTELIASVDAEILETKKQIGIADAENDGIAKLRLEGHLNGLEDTKQKLLDNKAEEHNIMLEKQGQLEAVELQLAQIDEVDAALAEVILSEVGLNGTREDGIGLLDEAIGKEKEQVAELQTLVGEQGGLNQEVQEEINRRQANIAEYERAKNELQGISGVQLEVNERVNAEAAELDQVNAAYREGTSAIDRKTSAQAGTNAKIEEGTGKAREQTAELGKDVSKNVNVTDNGTIAALDEKARRPVTKLVTFKETNSPNAGRSTDVSGMKRFQRHQGGPVERGAGAYGQFTPVNMLHSGGQAEEDVTQRFRASLERSALFNEVDVRLLRNETVLTESQQANLHRMIQAGQTGGSQPDNSPYFAQMVGLLGGIERAIKEADGDGNVNMRKLGRQLEPFVSEFQAKGVDRLNRWTP